MDKFQNRARKSFSQREVEFAQQGKKHENYQTIILVDLIRQIGAKEILKTLKPLFKSKIQEIKSQWGVTLHELKQLHLLTEETYDDFIITIKTLQLIVNQNSLPETFIQYLLTITKRLTDAHKKQWTIKKNAERLQKMFAPRPEKSRKKLPQLRKPRSVLEALKLKELANDRNVMATKIQLQSEMGKQTTFQGSSEMRPIGNEPPYMLPNHDPTYIALEGLKGNTNQKSNNKDEDDFPDLGFIDETSTPIDNPKAEMSASAVPLNNPAPTYARKPNKSKRAKDFEPVTVELPEHFIEKEVEEEHEETPIKCYICKNLTTKTHWFYFAMCPECGAFNYEKRKQTGDLAGKIALVTGCRIKIGYHTVISLLQCTKKFELDL